MIILLKAATKKYTTLEATDSDKLIKNLNWHINPKKAIQKHGLSAITGKLDAIRKNVIL